MRDEFAGKRVLVMGLGSFGGGAGAARFMVQSGAEVTVTDIRHRPQLAETIAKLQDVWVQYHLGGHDEADFTRDRTDIVVANPAVPRTSVYLKSARRNGLAVTSEMNLFFERCPAPIVGVTGSNGKSTTTAMIAEVLRAGLQRRVWLGGNIGGDNLLCEVHKIGCDDLVVLELSSFQLYDLGTIRLSPHVAVITNISPNHLDWHGSMAEYVMAKQNILRHQKPGDVAVLNRLDPAMSDWAGLTAGAVHWYPADGRSKPDDANHIELRVPGRHNQLNAAAALAVGGILGVDDAVGRMAIAAFAALPHRLELVRQVGGVRYYNDSIATTPESAIAALDAFAEPKTIILGGYDKKTPFDALAQRVVSKKDVEFVILLGQVRDSLADEIAGAKRRSQQDMPCCKKVDSLAEAVLTARDVARDRTVVLLSPACASYDMFDNFQQRGEQFGQFVRQL